MVRKDVAMRVSPSFHKLIKDTQMECYKNRRKILSSQEITSRIARKISKEEIIYGNNLGIF